MAGNQNWGDTPNSITWGNVDPEQQWEDLKSQDLKHSEESKDSCE